MNRKILLTTTIIASIFLLFLGMRNPLLSGGHGPKQRPRAIVEDTLKKSLSVAQHLPADAVYTPALPGDSVEPCIIIHRNLPCEISFVSVITPTDLAARAPPMPLSQFSS